MHKVFVKNGSDNDYRPTYVSIDGHHIRARSVNFNQSVDTIPTCEIEILALPDIEALADICFQFTSQSVSEASKVLRHNLIKDKYLYNAFLASITSALKELPRETGLEDVAKAIANRIIGEE